MPTLLLVDAGDVTKTLPTQASEKGPPEFFSFLWSPVGHVLHSNIFCVLRFPERLFKQHATTPTTIGGGHDDDDGGEDGCDDDANEMITMRRW